ncbi:MAG: UbiA prenyltransferase family protein [Promethearchaeota archaeon]
MKPDSKLTALVLFFVGLGFVVFGMVSEFMLGGFLPSEGMQNLYANGVFLVIVTAFFAGGMIIIRRGLLGEWQYRYDSIIYLITAVICLTSAVQTTFGLQAGHPWLELLQTNPILLNILWMFVLPPINPWTTLLIGACLILIAWWNYRSTSPLRRFHENIESKIEIHDSDRWWEVLVRLIRISVWLGSLFLFILCFILLGSPPLSPSNWGLLYFLSTWIILLRGILAVCLFNSAIFIVNQLGDLDTDSLHQVKAKLPISSGKITQNRAKLVALVLFSLGVIFAGLVSLFFLLLLLVTYFFAFLYSFPPIRLKSRPFLDLIIIGIGFGSWAVLAAWGLYSFLPMSFLPLSFLPISLVIGAGVFYAGTHGIHTASDYSADAGAGIKTTAVYLGPRNTTRLGVILIGVGLLLLYASVGLFTHLFWYGLLKYKTIFLLIYLGLPFFALFQKLRGWQPDSGKRQSELYQMQQQGRMVTYLLFIVLSVYLVFYVFLFYPVYYPHYFFPWS